MTVPQPEPPPGAASPTAAADLGDTRDVTAPGEVSPAAVLLDVREADEWAAGRAPGAVHIPLGELPQRLGEVPAGPVVAICRAGGRSAKAVDLLRAQGRAARNYAGGMRAWAAAGGPMTADGDAPPQVI